MVACLPAASEPTLKTFTGNSIELPSYSFNSLLFRSHSPCLADSRAGVSEVTVVEAAVKVTADGSSRVRIVSHVEDEYGRAQPGYGYSPFTVLINQDEHKHHKHSQYPENTQAGEEVRKSERKRSKVTEERAAKSETIKRRSTGFRIDCDIQKPKADDVASDPRVFKRRDGKPAKHRTNEKWLRLDLHNSTLDFMSSITYIAIDIKSKPNAIKAELAEIPVKTMRNGLAFSMEFQKISNHTHQLHIIHNIFSLYIIIIIPIHIHPNFVCNCFP
ncbi:hypothetical protein LXL04_007149 [Taraxacum kok-saghyz]